MKVAIIGMGPAGLMAACALILSKDLEIILIDKGTALSQRKHSDSTTLTKGIGGAGLYSDGKFSFPPSGSGIYDRKKMSQDYVKTSYKTVCELLTESDISTYPYQEYEENKQKPDGYYKPYPSVSSSLEQREKLINALSSKIQNSYHRFIFNAEVIDINKLEDRNYRLTLLINERNESFKKNLTVNGIIFAMGKYAGLFIKEIAPKLNLKMTSDLLCRFEIGFRVEFPCSIGPLNKYKNANERDVKLIKSTNFGEIRTFCTCRNGEVWNLDYNTFGSLSGRSDGKHTEFSNFGLLLRFMGNGYIAGKKLFEAILEHGELKQSNVLWATLSELMETKNAKSLDTATRPWEPKEKFKHDLSFKNIVPDFYSKYLTVAIGFLLEIAPDLEHPETVFLFPAIEGIGDYLQLDKKLRATDKIYCAGDAVGFFRGNTAALISGHVAGNALREDLKSDNGSIDVPSMKSATL